MKDLNRIGKTLCALGVVLLLWNFAHAQPVRPRKPNEPVVKPEEKPATAPTREQVEVMSELIRNVQVAIGTRTVTISFSTFPNTVPLVELANVEPKLGRDGRWGFPAGSRSITRPAGGDKLNGNYRVDMNQQLEPASTYYYIISARSNQTSNATRAQTTGKLTSNPATYIVRYRGFRCEETTDGPGSDEIYVIVSASFADSFGRPGTITEQHPEAIIENVSNGETFGDKGRNVYQGRPQNLLLTVTLMEHDQGNPYEYRNAVNAAVVGAYAKLVMTYPPLLFADPLTGFPVSRAMLSVSTAVEGVLGAGDDVIGTTTRLISTDEMRSLANQPSSNDGGTHYNFFTEHRGHGGVYRVYFDVVAK